MALSYNRFCYYEQHLCMKKLRPDNNKEGQYVLFKTKPIRVKYRNYIFVQYPIHVIIIFVYQSSISNFLCSYSSFLVKSGILNGSLFHWTCNGQFPALMS